MFSSFQDIKAEKIWVGPKKGDKIGDTISEEAGLDRAKVFRRMATAGLNIALVTKGDRLHLEAVLYGVIGDRIAREV